MTTLAEFRQGVLNVDLHLVTAADGTGDLDLGFGTTTERNQAIRSATGQLWPSMARLAYEDLVPDTGTTEYTLTSLREVTSVQFLIDGVIKEDVNTFRFRYDETVALTPARYLRVGKVPVSSTIDTVRVIGYIPYTIPDVDSSVLETPDEYDWIVSAGARREIARKMMFGRANYPQHNVQSRDNDVTMAELINLYSLTSAEWQRALDEHRKPMVTGHSAP